MGCNDGATCKDTHKFPMILTEFGYCGGYSNGYRIGYGNEYAHGKKISVVHLYSVDIIPR